MPEYKPLVATQVQIVTDSYGTKLKLWGCRTMYANVNSPRKESINKDGEVQRAQFDCEFLVPKNAPGVESMRKAIIDIARGAHGTATWHSALLSDGDRLIADKESKGIPVNDNDRLKAGCYIVKANSGIEHPPSVKGEIYSGCFAGAVIKISTYNNKGRGIRGYLNGVQFHGDAERLGGSVMNVEDELGPTPQQSAGSLPDSDDFGAGAYTGSNAPSRHAADDDMPF